MKKILLFLILLAVILSAYSQAYSLEGAYGSYVREFCPGFDIISDSEMKIDIEDDYGNDIKNQVVNYKVIHIDGMPFLQLSEPIDEMALEDFRRGNKVRGDDKMLFLSCLDTDPNYILRKKTLITYTRGYWHNLFTDAMPHREGNFSSYRDCTSYLVEGNKSYSVDNLSKLWDSSPWVENAKGYGIGESFVIVKPWFYKTLLIMNGYISYEKPYLYKQNGRIKQIRVTGLKSGKSKVLDVLDTPHPQTVDISFITESEDLKVEIVDVYKGTKYEDTCIHYLITFDREVIPYESEIGK